MHLSAVNQVLDRVLLPCPFGMAIETRCDSLLRIGHVLCNCGKLTKKKRNNSIDLFVGHFFVFFSGIKIRIELTMSTSRLCMPMDENSPNVPHYSDKFYSGGRPTLFLRRNLNISRTSFALFAQSTKRTFKILYICVT